MFLQKGFRWPEVQTEELSDLPSAESFRPIRFGRDRLERSPRQIPPRTFQLTSDLFGRSIAMFMTLIL
jgi:hypothetical protein